MSWTLPGLNFDSSSESTTDARTTGTQTENGGAVTVVQGTNNKSVDSGNVTVNLTDQGAVNSAFSIIGETIKSVVLATEKAISDATSLGKTAIEENSYTSQYAVDKVVQGYQGAGDLLAKGINDFVYFGERSLDVVRDSIDANQSIAGEALYQSQQVVDLTEKINRDNLYFLSDVNQKTNELTGQVIGSISDLEESRQIESGAIIKTIKELAETVQTGGESITTNANKFIALAVIAGAVVLGWRAIQK